jgi:adhesin transport system membrane fusion protein
MEKSKAKLLFTWLSNERTILSKVYTLAFLQGVMYIAIPVGIQGVVTYIMAGSFSASLILLCSITIVATTFVGFFQIWQMRINETLHQKVFGNLITRISLYLNNTTNTEDILSKLNKYFEVVTLQKGISKILLDFSFSLISIVFGVLLLPLYSPWFMFFTIIIGFTFYFIIVYYGKKGIDTNVKTSNEKYHLIEWFQKRASSNETKDEEFIDQTDFKLNDYIINRKSHYSVLEKQYKAIILFKIIFVGILLFFGAFLVQRGDLNIGQFVASEIIIFLVINSVEKLVSSLGTCYDIITALYKIEKIFGQKEEYSFLSVDVVELEGVSNIYKKSYSKAIKYSIRAFFTTFFIVLFMPWTQSVESKGKVTTLNPEGRPQTITSRIAGRVENWFISEGDFVKQNDTIAFISEIKDEYMDPMLISRSEQQIKAKETTLESYEKKVNAVNFQIDALNKNLLLKMEQTRNKLLQAKIKVRTDSIEAQTSYNNYKVAEEQLQRFEELLVKGVISKTDLENRRIKVQDALAKKTSAENKFMSTKNELLNSEIELNSVQQDYQEKIMKAESEKFSALSSLYEGEGSLTKLQGQLANYSMRKGYYYVLAPQDGFITKAYVLGIGEIVKEGAALCSIVPKQAEQAVELYINPIDLPLIQKGQNVQLTFDGWPAFVFTGWPGISFGTYQSEIVAFDKAISDNGKFRILVKNTGKRWPDAIQIGSGVEGFALLNNVPVIYEIWRKLNGFPPEFYVKATEEKKENKQDGKK